MATILSNGLIQFSDGRILYSDTPLVGQDFMELQALLPQINPVIGRSAMVGFPFVSGGGGGAGTPGARGADGAPGATGAQGPQGVTGTAGGGTGPQGVTGTQGATGPTGGPAGATGVQGGTGLQGQTGIQGPQGQTGTAGPQGQTGADGPQGQTGVQGPQGQTGITGLQGTTGVQGVQGLTGVQGTTGAATTGATGIQGVTGPGSGAQGATGVQGATGPTGGPQGVTGVQGTTGIQGATGAGVQGTTGLQGSTGVVSANAWIQGGNSFGATGVLGTIDAQDVNIIRGGAIQAVVTSGAIIPPADNTNSLGTNARRWNLVRAVTVTTGDLNLMSDDGLSNWTLKEEPDVVSLINRNTGRRYQIVMDEIAPEPAPKDSPIKRSFFGRLFGK